VLGLVLVLVVVVLLLLLVLLLVVVVLVLLPLLPPTVTAAHLDTKCTPQGHPSSAAELQGLALDPISPPRAALATDTASCSACSLTSPFWSGKEALRTPPSTPGVMSTKPLSTYAIVTADPLFDFV
jgi:hypothetical protein